jgi:hypothetical protein
VELVAVQQFLLFGFAQLVVEAGRQFGVFCHFLLVDAGAAVIWSVLVRDQGFDLGEVVLNGKLGNFYICVNCEGG